MNNKNSKSAYERQKKAREIAEHNLENKSRELYETNQSLSQAYHRLKDQKSQILHQEKLASIGQLAAGVAHEINNPTGFVKSNLNTLNEYCQKINKAFSTYEQEISQNITNGDGLISDIRNTLDLDFILEDLKELVQESLAGVNRIEEIVTSLKSFARPDQEEGQLFSITECIENTLRLLNSELKYKAKLDVNLETLPDINGKPGAMSQVFLNLIVNAIDAIADKDQGEITISSSMFQNEVRIKVSDNGSGIPAADLVHIFDPFYTTKDVGKGTGLGLSISHGIVKKHGGRISVSSEEGEGTEFIIFLPIPN